MLRTLIRNFIYTKLRIRKAVINCVFSRLKKRAKVELNSKQSTL